MSDGERENGTTERKFTPEEFKQELIKFQKSRPVVMSEEEYAQELDQTVILRYKRGLEILDEVVAEVKKAAAAAPGLDSDKIARHVDEAIVAFNMGHLGHNRCGRANKGDHSRVVLWYGADEK